MKVKREGKIIRLSKKALESLKEKKNNAKRQWNVTKEIAGDVGKMNAMSGDYQKKFEASIIRLQKGIDNKMKNGMTHQQLSDFITAYSMFIDVYKTFFKTEKDELLKRY